MDTASIYDMTAAKRKVKTGTKSMEVSSGTVQYKQ